MALGISSLDSVFYNCSRRLSVDENLCPRTSAQHSQVFSDYRQKNYLLFHLWGLRWPHMTVSSEDLKPHASKHCLNLESHCILLRANSSSVPYWDRSSWATGSSEFPQDEKQIGLRWTWMYIDRGMSWVDYCSKICEELLRLQGAYLKSESHAQEKHHRIQRKRQSYKPCPEYTLMPPKYYRVERLTLVKM